MNECRMTKLIIIVKTTRHLSKNEYQRYNIQVHRTRNKILIYLAINIAININGKVYEYIATYVDDTYIICKSPYHNMKKYDDKMDIHTTQCRKDSTTEHSLYIIIIHKNQNNERWYAKFSPFGHYSQVCQATQLIIITHGRPLRYHIIHKSTDALQQYPLNGNCHYAPIRIYE